MPKRNAPFLNLQKQAFAFAQDRDWVPFHTLKNLAINLSIESAELMEFFRWTKDEEIMSTLKKHKIAIEDEVGDVFLSLLLFCTHASIDLEKAFQQKLVKTALKYPIKKYKGKSDKYVL